VTQAVEAQGLVKTYNGRSGTVEAVRGVDLRVKAGEIFGFLGANGHSRGGRSSQPSRRAKMRDQPNFYSTLDGTPRGARIDGCPERR
jgi:ABC-type dipeptide/oligopeptide/nickel transport system ATPase component